MPDVTVDVITAAKTGYVEPTVKVLLSEAEAVRWGESIDPNFDAWGFKLRGLTYPVVGILYEVSGKDTPTFHEEKDLARAACNARDVTRRLRVILRKLVKAEVKIKEELDGK